MRVPAGVTLARGWAAFGLYESAISGVVFVPLLIVLIHLHGALGAASAWLILNIGSLLVAAPIVHAKVLPGEIKAWATWSVATPALIAFGLFAVVRGVVPALSPAYDSMLALAAWLAVSLICAMAMPHTRSVVTRTARRLFGS
jgi:hypothetical protein